MTQVPNKKRWLIQSVSGLLLTGAGLSMAIDAGLSKMQGAPWFWYGTIALIFFSDIFHIRPIYFYAYVLILLLSTAIQVYSARAGVMKKAEKITDDEDNASLFLDTKFTISESGVYSKDILKEQHFQWLAFTRKEENETYFYLFFNSMEALIIPKRILKTTSEKEQFEKLLSLHLSFDAEIKHQLKS